MIAPLTTEKDTWGARCGIYDHLPLLPVATKFIRQCYILVSRFYVV